MPPQYSQLKFTQDLNIYDWIYTLNYQRLLGNKVSVNLNEQYQATLQRISSQDRWKDTQDFGLRIGYPISSTLSVSTAFRSHILSDPLAGFDNDITFHSGTTSIVYQPSGHIFLSPSLSGKWQTQVEQSDQGYGVGIDARLLNMELDGYNSDLFALAERDFFPRRTNEDIALRYEVARQFDSSTADTLRVFFTRYRRDSFDADPTGLVVRNLSQMTRGVENRLQYRLAPDVALLVRNAVSSNTFVVQNLRSSVTEVRKDDAGFESRHSLRLTWWKPKSFGNFSWNFRARSRDDRRPQDSVRDPFGNRHPSLGFDTDETFANLALRAGFSITSSDSVGLFATASKFQFDTSDTTNSNDHDQVRWQISLSHTHRIGPHLQLIWQGSTFLSHFVYVDGKFSSGNNWERVFQLSPQILYRPSERFVFRQVFTVRAKYQTYDFDDPETSNRNIVNRQFVLSNSTTYSFSRRTAIEFDMNLELAEQGKLFYDLWRQRLALSWQNQEIQVLFRYLAGRRIAIRPGVHIFHQTRWNHSVSPEGSVNRIVRDKHTNVGPILEFSYRPSRAILFAFSGNVQLVNASGRPTERLNNFDVNLNWFF